MWDDEGLEQFVNWGFSKDYLFCELSENGISGVGIAYELPKPCDYSISSILPHDEAILNKENADLCIMDWVALNANARKGLVNQFCRKFPNWKNQNKYGMLRGKVIRLETEFIEKLKQI